MSTRRSRHRDDCERLAYVGTSAFTTGPGVASSAPRRGRSGLLDGQPSEISALELHGAILLVIAHIVMLAIEVGDPALMVNLPVRRLAE